jgi:16S rRNA (adenine1518-N6/adenine1519-N6)-dimethyltransferase
LKIAALPPLREVIARHELQATKSLGQNFLLDLNLTAKIARAAGGLSGQTVIEIGPGPGGLTRALLATEAKQVIAVEYDPRAVAALQGLVEAAEGKLTVLAGDALKMDIVGLGNAPRAIVANLPYNISTVLLVRWLRRIDCFTSLTLMFQREVAERLVATPGSKAYGRLSVMTGWLTEAKILFDVPPQAFTPPPKITSSIVQLLPRPRTDTVSFETMETVVAAAFNQRRKMLRASLKTLGGDTESLLREAAIDPTDRAEVLSVADFVRLSQVFADRSATA